MLKINSYFKNMFAYLEFKKSLNSSLFANGASFLLCKHK